ncbi:MAG: type II toxin-antitoxin system Phd/YefM family antitoxin [Eubacteriales bacterium]|nr:type II toxin-antitoxin system Phd/YefM family antitoxin [Eubacteriales bacterium]
MIINTDSIISITDANQNFSKAVKLVEENGSAVVFKNNKPKYVIYDIDQNPQIEMSDEEKVLFVGQRVLKKYLNAFKELAK